MKHFLIGFFVTLAFIVGALGSCTLGGLAFIYLTHYVNPDIAVVIVCILSICTITGFVWRDHKENGHKMN